MEAGTYYNTTSVRGEELKQRHNQVKGQTAEILHVFANCPNVSFTAWDIYEKFRGRFPITSVRRALHNLENNGQFIIQTGMRKAGPYKVESFVYQFNSKSI